MKKLKSIVCASPIAAGGAFLMASGLNTDLNETLKVAGLLLLIITLGVLVNDKEESNG